MKFEKIDICDVNDSFVHLIRDDWALLTAGEKGNYNTMTVSWGMAGENLIYNDMQVVKIPTLE